MNKKISALLLASLLTFIPVSTAYAAETQSVSYDTESISTRSVNMPAFYEYKSSIQYFTKKDYYNLYNLAAQARSNNNFSDYLGIASFVAGLIPQFATPSMVLGGMSYIKSDINANNICDVAFSQYRYLDITGVGSRKCEFKFKRFFDGNRMHDWYFYDVINAEKYDF